MQAAVVVYEFSSWQVHRVVTVFRGEAVGSSSRITGDDRRHVHHHAAGQSAAQGTDVGFTARWRKRPVVFRHGDLIGSRLRITELWVSGGIVEMPPG